LNINEINVVFLIF
jgi:Ca2+ transporting ATPase